MSSVFSPQCGLCALPDWWKGRRFILKSRVCRNGAPAARSFGGRASRLLCGENSLENCLFFQWLFDHRRTAQTISICRHAAARVTCVLNGFQFVIANLGCRGAAKFAFEFRIDWLAEAGGSVCRCAAILTCIGHGCSPLVELCAQSQLQSDGCRTGRWHPSILFPKYSNVSQPIARRARRETCLYSKRQRWPCQYSHWLKAVGGCDERRERHVYAIPSRCLSNLTAE